MAQLFVRGKISHFCCNFSFLNFQESWNSGVAKPNAHCPLQKWGNCGQIIALNLALSREVGLKKFVKTFGGLILWETVSSGMFNILFSFHLTLVGDPSFASQEIPSIINEKKTICIAFCVLPCIKFFMKV